MLVREIMTAPAVSIHADADLDDAIDVLAGKRITLLPVARAAASRARDITSGNGYGVPSGAWCR